MSFNDRNKKTLLNRNEEMNERKERFGDLVGFFLKEDLKGVNFYNLIAHPWLFIKCVNLVEQLIKE